MEENNRPLVSVIIITYNSEKFITETLEGVKNQDYRNLELIVSDDCSHDNTIKICSQWLEKNKNRFANTELITVDKNTGTSGNCNRALSKAKGKWLKFFGADDILMSNAISNYIEFVEGTDKEIVIAEAIHFSGVFQDKNFTYERIALENTVFSNSITAKRQYQILSKIFIGSGPTLFLTKACIEQVHGFNETYPLQEDYPLYIKLTKIGYKMHLMPIDTVYKRVHMESVSQIKEKNAIYPSMIVRCIKEYKYEFKRVELGLLWRFFLRFSLWLHCNVIDNGNDFTNTRCMFYYNLQKALDPFDWYSRYLNFIDKINKIRN